MKKLGKLKLNPERMLNHNELVGFKGGSGGSGTGKYCCEVTGGGFEDYCWTCYASSDNQCQNPIGAGTTQDCVAVELNHICSC